MDLQNIKEFVLKASCLSEALNPSKIQIHYVKRSSTLKYFVLKPMKLLSAYNLIVKYRSVYNHE